MAENVDQAEIGKFELLASRWWDTEGSSRPLHDINPVRLKFITQKVDLKGKSVIDVGCGGGILSESLAREAHAVTGIDMGDAPLTVARLHALESGLKINYQQCTAEQAAKEHPAGFEVATCMEMLEHVPDAGSVVQACAALVKPGGHLFFSTINRHPKAWLLAVLGAEYVLNLLPRGTHDYQNFIEPAELARHIRAADLNLHEITGMRYNPFTHKASLSRDVDVNYMVHASKPIKDELSDV